MSRVTRAGRRAAWAGASSVALLAIGTATSSVVASSVTSTTTAAPIAATTSAPATTTTVALPPDLLTGVNWLQSAFASACEDDTVVQMIGGSAVTDGARDVLDDVVAHDASTGLAVAFVSCHRPNGQISQVVAQLATVAARGSAPTVSAVTPLGAGARVVTADADSFTVEVPDPGSPIALMRRRVYRVSPDGIALGTDHQISVLERTIVSSPAVGDDVPLVRALVSPQSVCYRWNSVSLVAQDPPAPDDTDPIPAPSAEIQTIRLALILVTGEWIDPTSEMTPQMALVAERYQAAQGLTVDGIVGAETTNSLSRVLGCPASSSFRNIIPAELGPRRFTTTAALLSALNRFVGIGQSGNPSLDALLRESAWDGQNSLFLGCDRYESPAAGLACTWSGTTPLQLVGLVDDPATAGVANFSILYARSAAPN